MFVIHGLAVNPLVNAVEDSEVPRNSVALHQFRNEDFHGCASDRTSDDRNEMSGND